MLLRRLKRKLRPPRKVPRKRLRQILMRASVFLRMKPALPRKLDKKQRMISLRRPPPRLPSPLYLPQRQRLLQSLLLLLLPSYLPLSNQSLSQPPLPASVLPAPRSTRTTRTRTTRTRTTRTRTTRTRTRTTRSELDTGHCDDNEFKMILLIIDMNISKTFDLIVIVHYYFNYQNTKD